MKTLKKFVMMAALIAPVLSHASVTASDKIAARGSFQPGWVDEPALHLSRPMWQKPTQAMPTRGQARIAARSWRDPAVKPILWRFSANP